MYGRYFIRKKSCLKTQIFLECLHKIEKFLFCSNHLRRLFFDLRKGAQIHNFVSVVGARVFSENAKN